MREAREEMLQSLNESNLEKMRKAAGGAKQTLKMKDGSIGVDSFTASAIMKIYDQINDRNKKTFENMMKNGKKTDIMKLQKFAMSAVRAVAPAEYSEEFEEEFELDEGTKQVLAHGGKGQYKAVKDGDITKIMHKGKVVGTADFDSGADSFFVSMKGVKGQKSFDDAQAMVNYFAKNKITEEVELDEDIMPLIFGGGIIAALLPVLFMAVREIIRGTPLESSIKKIVDKLKKNKNYKMSDSEKSDVKGFVSKVKKEKPSLLQKAMKKIKEEVELDEKAGDTNDMKKLVGELQNASKMHLAQSKRVRAHLNMMKAGNLRGTVELAPIINELEKASEAHKRQSKTIAKHMEVMGEETLNEQPEHEITVGNYTTKHFFMCGSAQTVMKKHADKDGAEELTRMQDMFYKMEKDAMDAGSANDEQKKKSQILYDKIMAKAKEVGIANEVGKYMKMHLDSMLKGNPKLGFGRTDVKESYQEMISRIMSRRSMR